MSADAPDVSAAKLKAILNGVVDEAEKDLLLSTDFEPLEDLDDAEFCLPSIDFTPSLEEILKEEEDFDEDDDEEEADHGLDVSWASQHRTTGLNCSGQSSLLESLSVKSVGSSGSKRSQRSWRLRQSRGKRGQRHGAIMRHVILKGLSGQLSSARDRVDAGLPSAMAATGSLIAVGTSHGYILVFDSAQVLRWSLGGSTLGAEFGSVSALDFASDSTRLLAGFARGQLVEFDLNTGKLLQTLQDAHTPGCSILHARFTEDANLALAVDSGGSVYEVTFKKSMGVRGSNSRCIFSGSRDEVCAVQPLLKNPHDHVLVMALATMSKVLVLSLRPSLKVLFSHPLSGKSETLPILSWHLVTIQTNSNHKVEEPVLAFGRQETIYFYQMSVKLSGKVSFSPLQRLHLGYEILFFSWMNSRCLAIVDCSEIFHLYDVKNQEELESVDLSSVMLVYGSSHFKGLATGGNVSKAMEKAAEKAVYGAMATLTDQLIILGRQSVHVLAIRSWNDRLDHLISHGDFAGALTLACEFHSDLGRALVGLRGPRDKRKGIVAKKILETLHKFLDVAMTSAFPAEGDIHVLADYFQDSVPPCVQACMCLGRVDVLFGNVWESFSADPFGAASFLESLESFILIDRLADLPAGVCQNLVKHYETVRKLDALEALITHISVGSMDIHQVMTVCRLHGLYDGIFYVYNNGLLDYVTPLEELLRELADAIEKKKPLSQRNVDLGNKILVYVSCCLAGRAFPHGDIPKERIAQVKYDVYTCLTCLHTRRASESEPTYPHLRTLLHFDTQGLLNVIEIAFEEQEFQSDTGKCQKQRLVDILLRLMVREEEESEFDPAQLGHLFTFLARQFARGEKSLSVSRDLFEKVLMVLTDDSESRSHREDREQALLELLQTQGQGHDYFDRSCLIERAEKAGFYRVLERIYEEDGRWEDVLGTFLSDRGPRKHQAFAFVARTLAATSSDLENLKKISSVERSVISHFPSLVSLSAQKSASLVLELLPSYAPLALERLQEEDSDRRKLYDFLRFSFEVRENSKSSSLPFELLFDLTCEFEPEKAVALIRHHGDSSSHDLEKLLTIARKWDKVDDAEALLLEKSERVQDAFKLLAQRLQQRLQRDRGDSDNDLYWARINADVIGIVRLLQRSSATCAESSLREMWFSLLDLLLSHSPPEDQVVSFKDVVKHVVNSTVGHVTLRDVVERILKDPVYSSGSFGDIRNFMMEMLEIYHYEETMVASTLELVKSDLHGLIREKQRCGRRGLAVWRPQSCDLCRKNLSTAKRQQQPAAAAVFQCGHKFHLYCLSSSGCAEVTDVGEEILVCYKCSLTKADASKNRQILSQGVTQEYLSDNVIEETETCLDEAKKFTDAMKWRIEEENSVRHSIFEDSSFALKLWPETL